MKNSIWVAMGKNTGIYVFDKQRPQLKNGEWHGGDWKSAHWLVPILGLNLKPLEIVEIIIDTETQSYKVKRPREIGWYLTLRRTCVCPVVRFWGGANWCSVPSMRDTFDSIDDDFIKVISEKLPDNEYLRSLE